MVDAVEKSFETLRFSGDRVGDDARGGISGLSLQEQRLHYAHMLQGMLRVTPEILPGVSNVFEGVKQKLGTGPGVECFVTDNPNMGASCSNLGHSFGNGENPLVAIVLNSALVNLMTDDELAMVLGHELGHFIFSHRDCPSSGEGNSTLERVDALRLSRAAEISCDRIGFICSPDIATCFRAMLKIETGLSGDHFRADVTAYLDQLRDNQDILEHSQEIWSTHPMFPLRVKALVLFSMSEAYFSWAGLKDPAPLATAKMDAMIEKDFAAICDLQMEKIHAGIARTMGKVELWGALRLFVTGDHLTSGEQVVLRRHFGADYTKRAIEFLEGQSGKVVRAVESKLSEALGDAGDLPEEKRESLVVTLEKFAGAASGEGLLIIEILADLAGKLGIKRPVQIRAVSEDSE